MTAAAFLSAPIRPPQDPLWVVLGGLAGWGTPVAANAVECESNGCALVLSATPGTARLLSEASGSLGGLVPPRNVAVDCEGGIWLLGVTTGLLRRFDPCVCGFATVPCTAGREGGARTIVSPAGIAAEGATLFVCDAGPVGRLLLFDRRSFALRSVWQPPVGAVPNPWTPQAVAIDRGTVFVADKANGGIHRFARWGGWLGFINGFGAIEALTIDAGRRLFAIVPGATMVAALSAAGSNAGLFGRPDEVAACFAPPPFPVSREGYVDLRGQCTNPAGNAFDRDGDPVLMPASPDPAFASSGTWITRPLDSGIAQCVWHRISADAATTSLQRLRFATYTAEVELPDADVALLSLSAWTAVPAAAPGQDALILSPPGRYLWLSVTIEGDGATTPRLCEATIEYPRISLRRYLPAAFGSDPLSADFTDRLLAIFDRGFRDIETRIDDGAMLFDADSAPASAHQDVLGWIGAWLGIALERGWPEWQRRALVKAAGRRFGCRGTARGLRDVVLLWLGWGVSPVIARRPACGARCRPPAPQPTMPALLLEHWKLRRWLWLGKGRLGADAELWGETILGRSQLGNTARAGATRLDTTRNPLTDPFGKTANAFSIFVPARHVRTGVLRAQFQRLIDEHRPADARAIIVPVHPRMRIGIQASIGFDAVVGCWPSGITLDIARLGRGTVLSGTNPGGVTVRIGRTARLQPAARSSTTPQRECTT